MNQRWYRDAGVEEMVEHLDQPERRYRLDLLSRREQSAVDMEIANCAGNFEYAARNYFWIVDKNSRDILFKLWESQELILDKLKRLKEKGRPQKLMLLKARQLGASTLIEALIAWRTIFFPNINAMVISVKEEEAADMFSKMLHIYDMLPWWLQPMIANRKYEEGIWFNNPDPAMRRDHPGLNSRVTVSHSTQTSGIGQGRTIHAVHLSEYADWLDKAAKKTIDGDLAYALTTTPDTLAVLESTGHGAGTYAEKLWQANVELGEHADWTPLFLPWFFEKSRILAPAKGWHPDKKEESMRDRVATEWVRCDSGTCGEIREASQGNVGMSGVACSSCEDGTLAPYKLSVEQLYWIWVRRLNHEKKGADSVKEFAQEMATTAQDAWQLSGDPVFDEDHLQWVNSCIRAPWGIGGAVGDLDQEGQFHAVVNPKTRACYQDWCKEDHSFEVDQPLQIWEYPKPNCTYVLGVDVAAGLGLSGDWSVVFVLRLGIGQNPDVQVALYRSRTIDAYSFAVPVVQLGYWYNTALLSIEYNYPTTADAVLQQHGYPNLFQWKHYDSVNPISSKFHWQTLGNTKPKLVGKAQNGLRSRQWVIRSSNFHAEMKAYQKTHANDDRKTGAMSGRHDDELMAGMIAYYTAHDLDYETRAAYAPVVKDGEIAGRKWVMTCRRCDHTWGSDAPQKEAGCPQCGNIIIKGAPRTKTELICKVDFTELGLPPTEQERASRVELPYEAI